MRRWTGSLVAATLVVLVACSSGGKDATLTAGPSQPHTGPAVTVTTAVISTPASAPAKAVCDLLSSADVAKAVGNAVRAGSGSADFCSWGTAVDPGTSADVTIGIPAPNGAASACAVVEAALPPEATKGSVSGVGTSALWSYQKLTLILQGTLVACFPNAVVRVLLSGEADQAILQRQAIALAQLAQSRL